MHCPMYEVWAMGGEPSYVLYGSQHVRFGFMTDHARTKAKPYRDISHRQLVLQTGLVVHLH